MKTKVTTDINLSKQTKVELEKDQMDKRKLVLYATTNF